MNISNLKFCIHIFGLVALVHILASCEDGQPTGTEYVNQPPVILQMAAAPDVTVPGGIVTIFVDAMDPDGDTLKYTWGATGDVVLNQSNLFATSQTFQAPLIEGEYSVTVAVVDSQDAVVHTVGYSVSAGAVENVKLFDLTDDVTIPMVKIQGGSFDMGSLNIGKQSYYDSTDLVDGIGFVREVKGESDPLIAFIFSKFEVEAQDALVELDSNATSISGQLNNLIISELNDVLDGVSVYSKSLFGDIDLSERLNRLISKDVRSHRLIYLNRSLVDITFDGYLSGNDIDENLFDLNAEIDEFPRHEVTIGYDFWLGRFEVTQEQWQAVTGYNPSKIAISGHPIESVSFDSIKVFIDSLNSWEGDTLWRLPSEAEWEYACRAGSESRYDWGADEYFLELSNYAQYGAYTYVGEHAHIGSKAPNAFGIYDMLGNVWEWCEDTYHDDYDGAPLDGSPWLHTSRLSSRDRILRGGSWATAPEYVRSTERHFSDPYLEHSTVGFRLARWIRP